MWKKMKSAIVKQITSLLIGHILTVRKNTKRGTYNIENQTLKSPTSLIFGRKSL